MTTVVLEEIFAPRILQDLLQNNMLPKDVFDYFEEIAASDNEYLKNILSTTILEILGNDTETLKRAEIYMGPHLKQLQLENERLLGRM